MTMWKARHQAAQTGAAVRRGHGPQEGGWRQALSWSEPPVTATSATATRAESSEPMRQQPVRASLQATPAAPPQPGFLATEGMPPAVLTPARTPCPPGTVIGHPSGMQAQAGHGDTAAAPKGVPGRADGCRTVCRKARPGHPWQDPQGLPSQ